MEKTVKQWFEDSKNSFWKNNALTNLLAKQSEIIVSSLSEAIDTGFNWKFTPEGEPYWANIKAKIISEETYNVFKTNTESVPYTEVSEIPTTKWFRKKAEPNNIFQLVGLDLVNKTVVFPSYFGLSLSLIQLFEHFEWCQNTPFCKEPIWKPCGKLKTVTASKA